MKLDIDPVLPDPDGRNQHEKVVRRVREEIARRGGRIPFPDFMRLVLYAPGVGYYSAGSRKFGAGGDFVTAPEISPLFSQCLAQQCRQVLAGLPSPVILEVGAGSGVMACEIMRTLERHDRLPEYYLILDVSADLRQRQQAMVEATIPHLRSRFRWLDALPAQGIQGVVLANELLDALPIHRVRWAPEGLLEYYVAGDGSGFRWELGPLSDPRLEVRIRTIVDQLGAAGFRPGYCFEINLEAEAWLAAMSATLASGLMLIVDYGYVRREYYHPEREHGTMLCHFRHRVHDDPLILAGIQDITAYVDFTAVAEQAVQCGFQVAGFSSQAQFLLSAGLLDLAESAGTDERQRLTVARQIRTLTLPGEMGESFKAMALTKHYDEPLIGFQLQDNRGRL